MIPMVSGSGQARETMSYRWEAGMTAPAKLESVPPLLNDTRQEAVVVAHTVCQQPLHHNVVR